MASNNTLELNINAKTQGSAELSRMAQQLQSLADQAREAGSDQANGYAQAAAGLQKLAQQAAGIEAMKRELQQLAASGNATGAELQQLASRLQQLSAANDAIAKFRALQTATSDAEQRFKAARDELARMGNAMQAGGGDAAKLAQQYQAQEAVTRRLHQAYEQYNSDLQATGAKLRDQGIDTQKLAQAQQGLATNVAQARQSLAQMKQAADEAAKSKGKLAEEAGRAGKGFDLMGGAAKLARDALVGFGLLAIIKQFIETNAALENITRTLTVITGSSKSAASEMAYLKDVSKRLGTDVIETSRAYAELAAATKGTSVEGEQTRRIFESVTNAMSKAGKSSDDTKGALLALSQMASKGVVSMEELRGQLGERLPGALNAVADGFGITTGELIKLVETGQLGTDKLFPALADGLDKVYGKLSEGNTQTRTLTQSFADFKNEITGLYEEAGKSGALDGMKSALTGTIVVLRELLPAFNVIGKALGAFLDLVGLAVSGLASLAKVLGVTVAAILSFIGAVTRLENPIKAAKEEANRWAEAIGEIGAEQAKTNQQILGGIEVTKESTEADKAKTAATAAVKDETIQKTIALQKDLDKEKERLVTAGKTEDAAKAEIKTLQAISDMLGKTNASRQDVINAMIKERDASESKLKAALAEIDVQQKLNAIKQAEYAQKLLIKGLNDNERKSLEDNLQKLEQEQEQRRKSTEELKSNIAQKKLAIEAAQLEIETSKDNSARVGELARAYQEAQANLKALTEAKKQGKATDEQIFAAQQDLIKTTMLYRDALKDQTAAITSNIEAKKREYEIKAAGIARDQEEAKGGQALTAIWVEKAKAILEAAKARGDEAEIIRATKAVKDAEADNERRLIDLKDLEISQLKAAFEAKKEEADQTAKLAQAKKAEILASGDMTAAKQAEIKAAEDLAKAKQLEADKAKIVVENAEAEAIAEQKLAAAKKKAAEETEAAAKKQEDAGKRTVRVLDELGGAIAGMIGTYRKQLAELSNGAQAAYDAMFNGAQSFATGIAGAMQKAANGLQTVRNAISQITLSGGVFNETATKSIIAPALAIEERFYQAQIAALEFQSRLDGVNVSAKSTKQSLESTGIELGLLDDETLGNLKGAVDEFNRKVDDARGRVMSLKDELNGTITALQDELDRQDGNEEAIARRAFERERAKLEAQKQELANAKDEQGQQLANEAERLLEEKYNRELKRIREEAAAKKQSDADNAKKQEEARKPPEPTPAPAPAPQPPASAPAKQVIITFQSRNGTKTKASFDSQSDADAFLQQLQEASLASAG